jgi:hypothetical protein
LIDPCDLRFFNDFDTSQLLAWVDRHNPDVVVTNWASFVAKALGGRPRRGGAPQKPVVIGLNMRFGFEGPGIEENLDEVGAVAVNAVIGLMHRREYGIPTFPLNITVEGTWRDGPTPRPENQG